MAVHDALKAPVASKLMLSEKGREAHYAGRLSVDVLARIEALMPPNATKTAETGCGCSTIFFSNIAKSHTVFCLDDRNQGDRSSVVYFEKSPLFQAENVERVYGPTQITMPTFEHQGLYDCVLIDGPHGYPFPDLEYYYFYPHVKEGGLLVIDDVQIASIGRMADIIQEDAMWEFVEMARLTAIFRRTSAPKVPVDGDNWWKQAYNQRRKMPDQPQYLGDGKVFMPFEERVRLYRESLTKKPTGKKKVPKKKSLFKRLLGR
ncbi:class I SAM-dependent methyltransferase [Kordiimonas pumila]|uniref:Class I SAM-dependent methyltransferase n=1 Tax=Kordiimonas pumila TaxID=2161677 RepID=A0ABV7D2X0_9PROT|nr:class I SAM-dependent methyltransferase [Kordiimonas pumila]